MAMVASWGIPLGREKRWDFKTAIGVEGVARGCSRED